MTDCMCITLPKLPREDWEVAAKEMAAEEDDNPWNGLPLSLDGDDKAWTW